MSKIKGSPGYRAGWCIHFQSMGKFPTCEAGVRYDTFTGEDRYLSRMPCFIKPGEDPSSKAPCPHLRPPTAEEIAAHKEWAAGRLNQLGVVMTGIQPWREKHRGQSCTETVECPACKGSLRLSISSYNGHVHGHCSTEDCVSWME